ncbi:aldose epimerase family protein [Halalkalibacter akibai]|uniref:Aldose 1-epimerase n=1 Tax=Halalkalibacter akibai (strain ATCC 43226 / DSM 21942 / CIP 109018 / JCM 9157 / 1139) TaxID=1236973 RepID=W4QRM4_HALA3|nr:aldose epimerase family protein [Halalkalibacter akibai]GAE33959.1 aldose 1-epimerase [Halalkalibacter akibai JCM 9157]
MDISKKKFGELDGKPIYSYTLKMANGFEVTSINYGCIITDLKVPDAKGQLENVVLEFDRLEDYQEYSPYFGAVIGRVAGRINKASFSLEGKTYNLPVNDGNNHLHGGNTGLDRVVWEATLLEEKDFIGVEYSYLSPDGEEGYPGNVRLKVRYTIDNQCKLTISYEGTSDQATLLNLTNHTYFNLSGNGKRDILQHVLTLKSDQFLELNDELIPTGEFLPVQNTAFDFQQGRTIEEGILSTHPQNILAGHGYDHPFILTSNYNREILLEDPESGRSLTMETDEPCVVLYTGNQLAGDFKIRDLTAKKYLALCLETQKHPDAIHHSHFPSIVLNKNEVYRSHTSYTFSVSK